MGSKSRPIADRFWEKVDRSGGPAACWVWTAHRDKDGYGRFRHDDAERRAHRIAWALTHGPIPAGLQVLHRCDTPPCMNAGESGHPEKGHLFLGTNADNMKDKTVKGRAPSGQQNGNAKLTAEQVATMRARHAAGITQRALAAEYRLSKNMVWLIINNKNWRG